jgi:RND family efflux transporter MFP subunit
MAQRSTPPWLLVGALLAGGCGPGEVASHHAPPPGIDVSVTPVQRRREMIWQPVAGTVRPFDRAVVAARVEGSVTGANFVVGQSVSTGEVLLTLEADELHARLEQAKANLDQASRDAVRETALFEKGASTNEAARAAEDRLRAVRAALDEARTLSGYTRVTAPFAGTITRKLVRTGDFARAGTPLFEIEARDRMRAELAVPENLPTLPLGAAVRLRYADVLVDGHVTESSATLDPSTRTREVVVEFPGAIGMPSGHFVRALWPAGETDTISVPPNAITAIGQIERAFIVVDGKAVLRVLKTGTREPTHVHIVSGLEEGDRVIVQPPAGLRDGQPVNTRP